MSKELSGESDDEDIQNEIQRILGQPQGLLDSPVIIKELTKVISFTGQYILAGYPQEHGISFRSILCFFFRIYVYFPGIIEEFL